MEGYSTLLMIGLMIAVFYFLLIRPQRKRQQEALQMQNALVPGQRIMTTSGMFATVIAVDEDDVVLEIAPGVEGRFVKAAVGRVLTPVEEEPGNPGGQDTDAVDTGTDYKPDTGNESTRS